MENHLASQLAFFAMAVPVALEAYKERDRKVARIVLWGVAGVFAFLGFVWPWLGKSIPVVTGALTELVSSPSTWFIFFVGLYFVARPFWGGAAKAPSAAISSVADPALLVRVSELERIKAAIIDDYQAMLAKTETNRVDLAILTRDFEKHCAESKSDHERNRESLYALYQRERLSELLPKIEWDAAALYDRMKAGEVYDAEKWNQWENVHGHWLGMLESWIYSAQWYAEKVSHRIMTVDDVEYGGEWSVKDSQFPSAEAVRRFKKFCIIRRHWEEVRPVVERGIVQVAFGGLRERDLHRGTAGD